MNGPTDDRKYEVAKKVVETLSEEEIRVYLPVALAILWQLSTSASHLPTVRQAACEVLADPTTETESISAKKVRDVSDKISDRSAVEVAKINVDFLGRN